MPANNRIFVAILTNKCKIMDDKQKEAMQIARRTKAIKAFNPDYDFDGKTLEDLKRFMEENNIKMLRSKKEDNEEKEEKEISIDEIINNLIKDSANAKTNEDKLKFWDKIQKCQTIKNITSDIAKKKEELEVMEIQLQKLKEEIK